MDGCAAAMKHSNRTEQHNTARREMEARGSSLVPLSKGVSLVYHGTINQATRRWSQHSNGTADSHSHTAVQVKSKQVNHVKSMQESNDEDCDCD